MASQARLSLDQVAEILGRTRKAVEQLVHREALRVECEVDRDSGRTRRVWTTREWIDEYLAGPHALSRAPVFPPPAQVAPQGGRIERAPRRVIEPGERLEPSRTVLDELMAENLRLRLRVAEQEAQRR